MDDRPESLVSRDTLLARIDEIDRHVGVRLRAARQTAGRTQTEAGAAIGVTFQQIQKYELGKNRIAAGALKGLADFYARDVGWFYADVALDADAAAAKDWVLVCFGLFAIPDGFTRYVDQATRFTRAQAFVAASADRSFEARRLADFDEDVWKSPDWLRAELARLRRVPLAVAMNEEPAESLDA